MPRDYHGYRSFYQDVSDSLNVTTATDDATLVTVRNASHTIFLQKCHVQVTGPSAGVSWQLRDSASTPVQLTGPFAVDTDGSHFDMDFGPEGVPLTEGTNLVLDVSATGAAGKVTWEAYSRLTAVVAASAA